MTFTTDTKTYEALSKINTGHHWGHHHWGQLLNHWGHT